ncbi:kinesin light chain 1 [Beauveria brongniartii RCEF 3172]|uniref:Kinesin light chain 1 n=1 Tax=Beauveria brongniartii RCEF 3172 TaxID=1081107 RepID=A0A167E5P6_9HYPO|nr:kinesin light chain 1 [Beauveria brongniartii RCEF 3172]
MPPYAILSHTWRPDEVTFADLGSSGLEWQQKEGYQKIRFCAEQAKRHGLHHFWVDTCCIDKSNAIELQTAINSMFWWYCDANRCYVYMADVSHASTSNEQETAPWWTSFQKSRWFTRDWTLQELIAPKVVEFHSKDGTFLGDKLSLEYTLRDITGIPAKALRSTPLSEFTVTERESWARNRRAKYEEDMAYSLLGVFNDETRRKGDFEKRFKKRLAKQRLCHDLDAKRLVQELDGLPLALATAGAYLTRVSMKLTDYLRHYGTSWERLHKSTPSLGSYKDRTLCSTWQISYQQIEKQFPLAARLLRFWAYFDNQDLWFELIKCKNDGGPTWLRQLGDELVFNEAIGTLHDYGFVESCAKSLSACESQGYSIHSCLHSWTKHALNEGQDASLDRLTLECVASCVMQQLIDGVPNKDDASQALRLKRRLLSHAKISFARNQDRIEDSDQPILHALGQLYTSHELLDDAENMYSLAVRGCERTYGPDHVNTFTFLARLGITFGLQCRMKEAEDTLLRALCGQEQLLDTKHPFLVGRFEEAKNIYLEIPEKPMRKPGPEHNTAMFAALDLRWLYHIQNQFRKAEAMFRLALGGFEAMLGPNHKQTLGLVSRLGHLCMEQDLADKAEPLLARALRGYEEMIEPTGFAQSREALAAVADMGMLRLSQGQRREARGYLRRAHDSYMTLLGPDHARTRQTQTVLRELEWLSVFD